MKKGKFGIALFSAAVLALILLLAVHTLPEDTGNDCPVVIQAGRETVRLWSADGENFYGFLPGNTGDIQLLPGAEDVTVDGKALPVSSRELEFNTAYELRWQENGMLCRGSVTLLPSSGAATLFLDTQSGSMDYIHAEKGNAERGSLRLYDESGALQYRGSLASLRGRGNSTWLLCDKKPYTLELTEEADLLGMGAAKKWALLADAMDASCLRNKIVYDFAAAVGMEFAPETRWTEVYLNGEYAGLYLLSERVEAEPQRLNVSPDGALVCMNMDARVQEDRDPYFVTDAGQYLQIQEGSDIAALKEKIQTMEDALFSGDDSWQQYIDLDSWVKKYLIEEVFGNYDAGFQSQYFYCHDLRESSKVFAGPVWDFDSSLGNPGVWALNSPRGLFAWRPQAAMGYGENWYYHLYEKPAFRQALENTYREEFLPQLDTLLSQGMAGYRQQLAASWQRNRIRWNVESAGLEAEAAHIETYLQQRLEFLTKLWLEDEEYYTVRLRETQTGGYHAYYAVMPGACFEDLPEREEAGFLGWFHENTDEPFDPTRPITEDLCLYPRYEGVTAEPAEKQEGLKDVLLRSYHYVPVAVLVLMGVIAAGVSLRKHRGGKKAAQHSKAG